MTVTCWHCDVRPLADPSLFSRGMAALPWAERREQVMRFHFEKDRLLCLGAGLLLAHALRRAGARDLSLRRLSNGKPVPVNAPGIHFNLSHSGTLAVCAVSGRPVGVDVEVLQSMDPGVVSMCFQPAEQQWIYQAEDPCRAFTRLWTRKESYLKLMGTGLSCPPDSFCALPGAGFPKGIAYSEIEEAGHMICVCAQQGDDVVFKTIDISLNPIGINGCTALPHEND